MNKLVSIKRACNLASVALSLQDKRKELRCFGRGSNRMCDKKLKKLQFYAMPELKD